MFSGLLINRQYGKRVWKNCALVLKFIVERGEMKDSEFFFYVKFVRKNDFMLH